MSDPPRRSSRNDDRDVRDSGVAVPEYRPSCDHICLKDDGHIERGEPHFYGYISPKPVCSRCWGPLHKGACQNGDGSPFEITWEEVDRRYPPTHSRRSFWGTCENPKHDEKPQEWHPRNDTCIDWHPGADRFPPPEVPHAPHSRRSYDDYDVGTCDPAQYPDCCGEHIKRAVLNAPRWPVGHGDSGLGSRESVRGVGAVARQWSRLCRWAGNQRDELGPVRWAQRFRAGVRGERVGANNRSDPNRGE